MSEVHREGYKVETARITDLPEVRALVVNVTDGPHWTEHAWDSLMTAPSDACQAKLLLLIRGPGRCLCGWLAGTVTYEVAELEFLFVSSDHRHLGLGRSLLQAFTSMAKHAGATVVLLEVRSSNLVAIHLYRAMGFVTERVRPKYYSSPTEDAQVMRLNLEAIESQVSPATDESRA